MQRKATERLNAFLDMQQAIANVMGVPKKGEEAQAERESLAYRDALYRDAGYKPA